MRWLFLLIFILCIHVMSAVTLSITVDTSGNTKCCVTGNFQGSLIIEQFRWNQWCNVDTLGLNQAWTDTCITAKIHLHSGENQVRLTGVPTNPYALPSVSHTAKTTTHFECHMMGSCGRIVFTIPTYWELRDKNEVVLRSGYSSMVNSTGLAKGVYSLYFDNKKTEFLQR